MTIAVVGCGAMGRAAAHALARDHELVLDQHPARVEELAAWLATTEARADRPRVRTACLELSRTDAVAALLGTVDACAAALPWDATRELFRAAVQARRPVASITRPDYPDLREVAAWPGVGDAQIVFPVGLEPGLTEILAVETVRRLRTVHALRVRCGGVPADPEPPLRYRLLFDTRLPLTPRAAYAIEDGRLVVKHRFEGIESFAIDGVGTLECHHDGMVPWMIDDPVIGRIPSVTQKTVRWPGFAQRVAVLEELGLLADAPVDVAGARIAPRDVVEAVLAPTTRRRAGDVDLTILRVEADGLDDHGRAATVTAQIVDRFDPRAGLTAMARTTGYTLASVAEMLARGEIAERGLVMPHRAITGPRLERLLSDLRDHEVHVVIGTVTR